MTTRKYLTKEIKLNVVEKLEYLRAGLLTEGRQDDQKLVIAIFADNQESTAKVWEMNRPKELEPYIEYDSYYPLIPTPPSYDSTQVDRFLNALEAFIAEYVRTEMPQIAPITHLAKLGDDRNPQVNLLVMNRLPTDEEMKTGSGQPSGATARSSDTLLGSAESGAKSVTGSSGNTGAGSMETSAKESLIRVTARVEIGGKKPSSRSSDTSSGGGIEGGAKSSAGAAGGMESGAMSATGSLGDTGAGSTKASVKRPLSRVTVHVEIGGKKPSSRSSDTSSGGGIEGGAKSSAGAAGGMESGANSATGSSGDTGADSTKTSVKSRGTVLQDSVEISTKRPLTRSSSVCLRSGELGGKKPLSCSSNTTSEGDIEGGAKSSAGCANCPSNLFTSRLSLVLELSEPSSTTLSIRSRSLLSLGVVPIDAQAEDPAADTAHRSAPKLARERTSSSCEELSSNKETSRPVDDGQ